MKIINKKKLLLNKKCKKQKGLQVKRTERRQNETKGKWRKVQRKMIRNY